VTRRQRMQHSLRSPQRAHHKAKKRDKQQRRAQVIQGMRLNAGVTIVDPRPRVSRAELDALFLHQGPEDRPVRSAKPTPWWHKYWPEKARQAREERQP